MKKIASVTVCATRAISFDGELNEVFRRLDARGASYDLKNVDSFIYEGDVYYTGTVVYEYDDAAGYVMY